MQKISEKSAGRAVETLSWSSRITGLTRVLGGVLFLALLHTPLQAAQTVNLAWEPSPDSTVTGYNMYYGVASGTYTNLIDVGNASSGSIPSLVEGTTYFIAATAYNILGLESIFSNELSYTVPTALVKLKLRVGAGKQVVLTVTGQTGHSYDILATQSFAAWTVIGTVTLGPSGSLEFVDPSSANFPARFYHVQEKP